MGWGFVGPLVRELGGSRGLGLFLDVISGDRAEKGGGKNGGWRVFDRAWRNIGIDMFEYG
jgi:hypothetical protein